MTDDTFSEVLAPIVRVLIPHLERLIVIGGWVPELHRRFGAGDEWAVEPLRTFEVDVFVTGSEDDTPLGTTLETAGFRPVGGPPSAVWERDVVAGERIEFFVDHDGPWNTLSTVATVESESVLGGLRLDGLDVLRQESTTLAIPVGSPPGEGVLVNIRVPDLGAFLVHKGAVFRRRTDVTRMTKDLHYVVDVMQSGESIVETVAGQIAAYCEEGGAAAELARSAGNQVGLVVGESSKTDLRVRLASALAERHSLSATEGDALALGYLSDFLDLIPEDCGDV